MDEVGEDHNVATHPDSQISQEETPRWMDEEVEVDESLESMVELGATQQRIEGVQPMTGQVEMAWSDVGGKKAGRTGPATRATTDRTHIPSPAAQAQATSQPELTACVTPRGKKTTPGQRGGVHAGTETFKEQIGTVRTQPRITRANVGFPTC
jgi:hypothetical protein